MQTMSAQGPDPEFLREPEPGQQPYGAPAAGVPPQPVWGGPVPLRPDEERTWAVLAHALPLVGLGFLAPLVIWLCFRGRGPYLEDQAKEALNFQLTLLIGVVVGVVTLIIVVGIFVLIAVSIASLVFGIIAAIAASRYEWYRYPFNIRFVR